MARNDIEVLSPEQAKEWLLEQRRKTNRISPDNKYLLSDDGFSTRGLNCERYYWEVGGLEIVVVGRYDDKGRYFRVAYYDGQDISYPDKVWNWLNRGNTLR